MDDGTPETNWRIFTGSREPHDGITRLPEAPPWRRFGKNAQYIPPDIPKDSDEDLASILARKFRSSPEMKEAVNVALYLRRPLLVTGKPGNGKSSLVLAVARELKLGRVLRWPITSKTTLKDGLYLYDALGRLEEVKRKGDLGNDSDPSEVTSDDSDIGRFIELGPLGTALLPTTWPKALLIDEIDKSDLDLPNDLLNIFEEGEYSIPELARARLKNPENGVSVRTWRRRSEACIVNGHIRCTHFPFVIMTSNREREFPPAFLRRCIRITIEEPDDVMLGEIVESHFDEETKKKAIGLITQFFNNRKSKELATDQLLNAVYLILGSEQKFSDTEKNHLIKKLYQPISGPEAMQ
jgi:MoxR-like ATPase